MYPQRKSLPLMELPPPVIPLPLFKPSSSISSSLTEIPCHRPQFPVLWEDTSPAVSAFSGNSVNRKSNIPLYEITPPLIVGDIDLYNIDPQTKRKSRLRLMGDGTLR